MCGCPDLGTCLRARPGMTRRKGAKAPGVSPCAPCPAGGHGPREAGCTSSAPGGHSPATPYLRAKRQSVLSPGRRT
eukprot:753243-Prymnesium_polylepis.1